MPLQTRFVNKAMLVVLNRLVVQMTGGTAATGTNLRDGAGLGFVELIHHNEIFGQPVYPDLYHRAAAYMFYVIKNHVFLDGNKRTGLAAAVTFLQWNGLALGALDEDASFDFVEGVAGGPNDPDTLIPRIAEWLRGLCG